MLLRVMVKVFTCIYRIFYIQMRFTLFQCKGEIGYQHNYIGAAGGHYQSISDLTQPTQPMNHKIAQRPDQHTGNSMPYSSICD